MTIISTTKKNMHPNRIVMIGILFIPLHQLQVIDLVQPELFYRHFCNYLIDSFIHQVILFLPIFKIPSIPNHKSQRPNILRECSPSTMCCMSGVMYRMSGAACNNFLITKFLSQLVECLLSTGPTLSSFISIKHHKWFLKYLF